MDPILVLWLALLSVGAAIVTGAVGYGFSSIVTPIGVLWFSNRLLNPALVIVELAVNGVLLFRERGSIRAVWPRSRSVVSTLLPGVLLGTLGLTALAINDVKLVVYGALLPLTALQLLGWSRPIRSERGAGRLIGPGVGFLYALTTISGPPLAIFLRNQGLSKSEFRCAMAQIRVAESSLTLAAYALFTAFLGSPLLSAPSLSLLLPLGLPVLIGVPLGAIALRSVSPEPFRRLVMVVDGVLVSFGVSQVVVRLGWVTETTSYVLLGILLSVVALLGWVALQALRTGRGLGARVDDRPHAQPLPAGRESEDPSPGQRRRGGVDPGYDPANALAPSAPLADGK